MPARRGGLVLLGCLLLVVKPTASPPSRRNGYPVKGGVFETPLDDFVHVFKAVTYETSAPLSRK